MCSAKKPNSLYSLVALVCFAVCLPAGGTAQADPPDPDYRYPAVFETGGGNPYGMALGFINNDALLDLVVANQAGVDSSITVFLNTGDWADDPPDEGFEHENDPEFPDLTIRYTVPGNLNEPFVALGDFNSDNKLDIVVNEQSDDGEYFIFFNNGDGTFGRPTTYSLNSGSVLYTPYGVGAADFDNDGKQDVALATHRYLYPVGVPALVIAWGDGGGQFTNVDYVGELGSPFELVIANFDSIRGLLDVVMCDPGANWMHVCINGGNRNFTLTREDAVRSKGITACKTAPYTRPGADVALTKHETQEVHLYRNNGDGTFDHTWDYNFVEAIYPVGIATGNLNKDSVPDLVTANQHLPDPHGGVSVFVGTGQPAPPFQTPPFNFSSGDEDDMPKPHRVVVGDVNNDGMDDIVTSNFFGRNVSVLIQKVSGE